MAKPKPCRSYELTGDILDHNEEFSKFFAGLVEILQNKMQKREVKGKRHSYYTYDCGQPHDRRNYNWDPFKNMWDRCDKTRIGRNIQFTKIMDFDK